MLRLEAMVRKHGFENFGFAELETPISIDLYDRWIDDGMNGEMEYLERHKLDKRVPNAHFKRARTAIVITQEYVPHPSPIEGWPLSDSMRIAGYARGKDYHRFLHSKLRALSADLTNEFPGEEFLSFTDAGPVLERDLAARAGLGFVGKNTCLID
jgi:epoxyqueuosine reductase